MSAQGFLFDVNVWVALAFKQHSFYAPALAAFQAATSEKPAVMCRVTELGFLRVSTTPAVVRPLRAERFSNRDSLRVLQSFLALPEVRFDLEPEGVRELWHRLADRPTASPKVWMDAYLAAFAIKGGLTMVTADQDMKAFAGAGLELRWLIGNGEKRS